MQNPSLLQHLDLSDNEMSGALPESMYTLTELVTLYIQYNAFSGGALIQYHNWPVELLNLPMLSPGHSRQK